MAYMGSTLAQMGPRLAMQQGICVGSKWANIEYDDLLAPVLVPGITSANGAFPNFLNFDMFRLVLFLGSSWLPFSTYIRRCLDSVTCSGSAAGDFRVIVKGMFYPLRRCHIILFACVYS